jgi:hypothetical protein
VLIRHWKGSCSPASVQKIFEASVCAERPVEAQIRASSWLNAASYAEYGGESAVRRNCKCISVELRSMGIGTQKNVIFMAQTCTNKQFATMRRCCIRQRYRLVVVLILSLSFGQAGFDSGQL